MCPRGCVPLKTDVSKAEAPKDKLKREATESYRAVWQGKQGERRRYDAKSRGSVESIESTGTYTHTIAEIRHKLE